MCGTTLFVQQKQDIHRPSLVIFLATVQGQKPLATSQPISVHRAAEYKCHTAPIQLQFTHLAHYYVADSDVIPTFVSLTFP